MWATDVYLLAGFLGAGKTTLLKRLLDHPWEGKSAVVVNEFGSVGIDGNEVRRGSGFDLIEIASGCVCCTLRGRFVESFRHLLETVRPHQIFVEASGVSEPSQILEPLRSLEFSSWVGSTATVTVVDATFFPKREVLGGFYEGQIQEAQILLLNKVDKVSPDERKRLRSELAELNPAAQVFETIRCEVDLTKFKELLSILPGGAPRQGRLRGFDEAGKPKFSSFSVEVRSVLSVEALDGFLRRKAGEVLRAKGWARTERGACQINYSAHGLDLEPADPPSTAGQLVFVLAEGIDPVGLQMEFLREFQ